MPSVIIACVLALTVTSVFGNICQPSISIDPLENSCYNIGNKIPFRYDADCFPKSTKIEVRVCQMFPVIENRCFFYDYIRSDKYDFKLEVTSALIPGNIYCLEVSSSVNNYYDQKIIANGGLFTVTEKGCDYGKCHRMALPYTPLKECYKVGENIVFSYKAVCYTYPDADVHICDPNNCKIVTTTPLVGQTFSISAVSPEFPPNQPYSIKFTTGVNNVLSTSNFFVAENCEECTAFELTTPLEACYKFGTKITISYKAVCYSSESKMRFTACSVEGCSVLDELNVSSGTYVISLVPKIFKIDLFYRLAFVNIKVGSQGALYRSSQFLVAGSCY